MVKSTDGNRLEEDIKTVIHMISSNEMETFWKTVQEMNAEHKIWLHTEIRRL
jgi:hypothetical protein